MNAIMKFKGATRLAVCLTCLLSVAGCSSDEAMRDKFGDGMPYFFTEDKTGDKYIITHNIGDTYSLRLWEKKHE